MLRQLVITLCLLISLGSGVNLAYAQTEDVASDESVFQNPSHYSEIAILEHKLRDEQDVLEQQQAYLEKIGAQEKSASSDFFDSGLLEQTQLRVDLSEVQAAKLSLNLSNARKDIILLKEYVAYYEKQLINAKARGIDAVILRLEERLLNDQKKLAIEEQRVGVLQNSLAAAQKILQIEKERLVNMTEQIRLEQVSNIWEAQQQNEVKWIRMQREWENKLEHTRIELEKLKPLDAPLSAQQQLLQDELREAEEYLELIKEQLTLSRMDALLSVYKNRAMESDFSKHALEMQEKLARMHEELLANQVLVDNKKLLIDRELEILKEPGAKQMFSSASRQRQERLLHDLQKSYEALGNNVKQEMESLTQFQNQLLVGVKQTWKTRQKLPMTKEQWRAFGENLWVLPQMIYQSGMATYRQVVENLSQSPGIFWVFIFTIIIGWCGLCIGAARWLANFLVGAKDKGISFSANAFIVIAQLLYRNIVGIAIFGALTVLLLLLQVSSNHLVVPLALGLVWFMYRIAIGLARIYLFENIWDLSGRDVKLYRGLKWSMGFGSIIIAMTILAHQLPIPQEIIGSFDRLFMLVLLAISIPLLKGWHVFPGIMAKEGKTKAYVRKAIYWLGFLIPFTIFSNAVIGLIGYVNLAWIIWVAEAQFLMVLTIWVLLRGLIGDVMEFAAKWAIRNLKSGWVWTEAILKPLNTVLHAGLILLATLFLLSVYGLRDNIFFKEKIYGGLFKPLFEIGSSSITPLNIIQFIVLLIVIRWAAKWSREFAYRFLFAKQKDKGLRNSFAVFTQYATIALGGYVILQVVGIDLTALTVVLGALAVGIGIGLQNIANNLASGFLLLIERPFRAGDIISLGAHEGEVVQIGARATTIRTWDNTDVIIPNAEMVSQALTNWTHQDAIVRTTFTIQTQFDENPYQIQALLLNLVRSHPSVISHPEPSVLLGKFGEYAQVFEIRYHIDLNLGKSRGMVQSEMLLIIWDHFKAAGVDFPYPHQSVQVDHAK